MRLILALCVLAVVALGMKPGDDAKQLCVGNTKRYGSNPGETDESEKKDACVRPRGKSGWLNFCLFDGDENPTNANDDQDDEIGESRCFRVRLDSVYEMTKVGGVPAVQVPGSRISGQGQLGGLTKSPPAKVAVAGTDESSEMDPMDDSQTIRAKGISLSKPLPGGKGIITLKVLIFEEAGTIMWHGTPIMVRRGSFKIVLDIQEYVPTSPTAEYLAVVFEIKTRGWTGVKPSPRAGNRDFTGNNGADDYQAAPKAGVWTNLPGGNAPAPDMQGMPVDVIFNSGTKPAVGQHQEAATQTIIFPLKDAANNLYKFIRFDPTITLGPSSAGLGANPNAGATTTTGTTSTSPGTSSGSSPNSNRNTQVVNPSAAPALPLSFAMVAALLAALAVLM